MDKKIWTACAWRTMHAFAASATTPEERLRFVRWIHDFAYLLPCPKECRPHMLEFLHSKNPKYDVTRYLKDNVTLLQWTWIFHNAVNKRLGKKEVSFESVKKFYLSDNASCPKCNTSEQWNF